VDPSVRIYPTMPGYFALGKEVGNTVVEPCGRPEQTSLNSGLRVKIRRRF